MMSFKIPGGSRRSSISSEINAFFVAIKLLLECLLLIAINCPEKTASLWHKLKKMDQGGY